jgi:hypothetical protein
MKNPTHIGAQADPLDAVFQRFTSEIDTLRDFMRSIAQAIDKKTPRLGPKDMSPADQEEMKGFMKFLDDAIKGQSKKSNYEIESPNVGRLVMSFMIPIKERTLLNEMVLIYSNAQFEGFLKDALKAAFVLKPDCLKSNRQLTYEEAVSRDSRDELLEYLAQREADDLGRGSIDAIDAYYTRKFNIALSASPSWKVIREGSYRRNLFVHNRGVTNDIYCKAVGYPTVGTHLTPDFDYIKNLLKHFRGIARFTYTHLKKKVRTNAASKK